MRSLSVSGIFYNPFFGADGRGRTGTGISSHGILNPGRLPIPPHRLINNTDNSNTKYLHCQYLFLIFYPKKTAKKLSFSLFFHYFLLFFIFLMLSTATIIAKTADNPIITIVFKKSYPLLYYLQNT